MKPNLIICGNYGAGNIGDEAILRALIERFKGENRITVMSADPEGTAKTFGVKTLHRMPSGWRSWGKGLLSRETKRTKRAIKECDRFLLGGGTLLTDEPRASLWIWGNQVKTAFKYKRPVEIYANGIGPFKTQWTRKWASKILRKAERVSVRDKRSFMWAKELGRQDVDVLKDPVLEWSEIPTKCSKNIPQNTVILAPRFWSKNADNTLNSIKKIVQYLCLKEGKKVIGIPFEKDNQKDVNLLSTIFEQSGVGGRAEIWDSYTDDLDVLTAIKKADMVVGMRLHSLIFAHIAKTPFIGIAYMEKVSALGEELNQKEAIIDLDDLSEERLIKTYQSIAS